tara:strand:- start:110 stop:445 length:336 start_codon:yes stop_codon:yes gene_type:complete
MKNKTIEKKATNNFTSFKVQGNGRRFDKSSVITLNTVANANKLPHQAQCILSALASAEGNSLTVEQLIGEDVAGLNSALDKVVEFNTVQTPAKIWQFYKNRLIKSDFITVA